MEVLFAPFAWMISVPGGAFVPCALLGYALARRWRGMRTGRRWIAGVSVGAWVVYAIYETRMYFWMQSVVAPIRVDLLLIAPILTIAAALALLAILVPARKRA